MALSASRHVANTYTLELIVEKGDQIALYDPNTPDETISQLETLTLARWDMSLTQLVG